MTQLPGSMTAVTAMTTPAARLAGVAQRAHYVRVTLVTFPRTQLALVTLVTFPQAQLARVTLVTVRTGRVVPRPYHSRSRPLPFVPIRSYNSCNSCQKLFAPTSPCPCPI